MINIVDLFSGAGGLTEGFRGSEFNIVSHVEMDKAACQTLQVREIYYHLKNNNNLNNYNEFEFFQRSVHRYQNQAPLILHKHFYCVYNFYFQNVKLRLQI